MSDPAPEDLYEALRKRLADYGQEPPPELWAGIRQLLPPPVAVPRRRRWRASLVLLGLLLVVASLATWQWPRGARPAAQTGTLAEQAPATGKSDHAVDSRTSGRTVAATAAGRGAEDAAPSGTGPAASTAAPSASGQLLTPETKANSNELAVVNRASTATESETADFNSIAKSVTPAAALKATSRSARRPQALAIAGITSGPTATRKLRGLRATRAAGPRRETTSAGQLGSGAATSLTGIARTAPPAPAANPYPASTSGMPMAGEPVATSPAAVAAAREADTKPAGRAADAPSVAPGSEAAIVAAQPDRNSTDQWSWLNARLVGLQLPAGVVPAAPQPVAVPDLPPLAATVVARWAVQLVAGPGLTYRYLSPSALAYAAPTLATPVAASPLTSGGSFNSIPTTTTSSAALERPALGYGAQLSLRRTLTPHWTLSGGLGYAEYATQLALRQVNASQITRSNYSYNFLDSLSQTNGTTIRQRDTYRFLTVPLRAGYVWTAGPRWQVGLLGGFEAAIYLGGTSTEGSSCACQPQTWSASGSPYRRLSLGASLSAEVRYRLAGPWQLLAQPTASYLLTPLAKPMSGYSIRHLLGGTALLGVSYDLP